MPRLKTDKPSTSLFPSVVSIAVSSETTQLTSEADEVTLRLTDESRKTRSSQRLQLVLNHSAFELRFELKAPNKLATAIIDSLQCVEVRKRSLTLISTFFRRVAYKLYNRAQSVIKIKLLTIFLSKKLSGTSIYLCLSVLS